MTEIYIYLKMIPSHEFPIKKEVTRSMVFFFEDVEECDEAVKLFRIQKLAFVFIE